MTKSRLLGVWVIALVAVMALTPVAVAHGGTHFTGAETTARYDGVYAEIEVADPSVRAGTDDQIKHRIRMTETTSGGAWIEVGWLEYGMNLVSGAPEQYVYVNSSAAPQDDFLFGPLSVAAGSHIDVQIVKASSCDIGDPSCTYIAQRWNHSTLAWTTLRSVVLPMDRGYLEEFTKVYQDPSPSFPGHISVDTANNDMDWTQTKRRHQDDSWHLWGTSNTVLTLDDDGSYCSDWINLSYRFEAQNGFC